MVSVWNEIKTTLHYIDIRCGTMQRSCESSPLLSAGGGIFARRYEHAWRTTSLVSVTTDRQNFNLYKLQVRIL